MLVRLLQRFQELLEAPEASLQAARFDYSRVRARCFCPPPSPALGVPLVSEGRLARCVGTGHVLAAATLAWWLWHTARLLHAD